MQIKHGELIIKGVVKKELNATLIQKIDGKKRVNKFGHEIKYEVYSHSDNDSKDLEFENCEYSLVKIIDMETGNVILFSQVIFNYWQNNQLKFTSHSMTNDSK